MSEEFIEDFVIDIEKKIPEELRERITRINSFFEKKTNNYEELLANVQNEDTFYIVLLIEYLINIYPLKMKQYTEILCEFCKNGDYKFNDINTYNSTFKSILIQKGFLPNNSESDDNSIESIYDIYQKGTIERAIKDDDVKSYISCRNAPDYSELILRVKKDSPLFQVEEKGFIKEIQLICFYGAVNCYKNYYLSGEPIYNDEVREYAIAGGNLEIIHLLEQNGCSFDRCFLASLKYHHNNITRYLLENYKCEPVCLSETQHIYNDKAFFFILLNGINVDGDSINKALIASTETCNLPIIDYLVTECDASVQYENSMKRTPLWIACQRGYLNIVKYYVDHDADVEARDINNYTPLHFAAFNNQVSIVKYLIEECKVDVNAKNDDGDTILTIVSSKGYTGLIKYIVNYSNNVDIAHKNDNGYDSLLLASAVGNLELVQYLIKECKISLNSEENNGYSPLHIAAKEGHLNIVRFLIEECHANSEIQSNDGSTPLHIAVFNERFDIVEYLIKKRHADIFAKNLYGIPPLYIAIITKHKEIINIFIDCLKEKKMNKNDIKEIKSKMLFYSIVLGDFEILKYFIEKLKFDPKFNDALSSDSLLYAAMNNNLEIVKYLIEKCHMDPETKYCNKKKTILDFAIYNDSIEMVKYLVEFCKMNIKTEENINNYFGEIGSSGCLDILKYFVEKRRIPPDKSNKYSSLNMASFRGHLSIVKYLIEKCHFDPDHCDCEGKTPLVLASQEGRMNIVKYLVEKCRVDIMKNAFIDPLKYITESEKKELFSGICDQLSPSGFPECQPFILSDAISAAINGRQMDIIKYFIEKRKVRIPEKIKGLYLTNSVESDNLEALKYFIEKCHINPNAFTGDKSALQNAVFQGNLRIAKYLVEKCRVNPYLRDMYGFDSLEAATQEGQLDLVKYFMENCGMDKNLDDTLHIAIVNNRLKIIEYLLTNYNIDLEKTDKWGRTPLLLALYPPLTHQVKYGKWVTEHSPVNIDVVNLLLSAYNDILF